MDFKGHFALERGGRCHPLTILDDHSRFNLALRACGNEKSNTVRRVLHLTFEASGLPEAMLMDNGPPWRDPRSQALTRLDVWLMKLDVLVIHGRPRHPQTQGKDERFHRTLDDDLLKRERFDELEDCQRGFDAYRQIYNWERPHEALGMDVPADHYRESERRLPLRITGPEYGAGSVVRRVQAKGWLSFRGREYRVSKAFQGERVCLEHTDVVGELGIYFGRHRIGTIDLKYLDATSNP